MTYDMWVAARECAKVGAAPLALLCWLGACGSPPAQETAHVPASDPPAEADPPEATPPTTPAVAEARVVGPPPVVTLTGTPAPVGDHVAISLVNRGTGPVEIGTAVALEVQRDGTFVALDHPGLSLRYDCAQEAPACVTLGPGAELLPPEWLGTWGDMQCVCSRCGPAEAGTYRFVVSTCDGAHRVEGAPFTIDG